MDGKLDFDDVLIRPRRSPTASRAAVELEREFRFFHSPKIWQGVGICASNMDTTGTFAMALALANHKMITCLHKHYPIDTVIEFLNAHQGILDYIFFSTGITDDDLKKLNYLSQNTGRWQDVNICVDVANGYTDFFVERVAKIRDLFPESIIIAGNVATDDMVQQIILYGKADIVKIGIGPGSVCSTRMVTGVGYPQLSAIQECSKAAHGLKQEDKRLGLIMADGGCKTPGDVCKALAAGSDFVMLGGMFAGTEECEGDWQYTYRKGYINGEPPYQAIPDKKISLKFYGMSSYEAQDKYGGERRGYRASEGECVEVPYKGPVDTVLKEILGGIRSCCAYVGATRTKDLPRCADFIRINRIK